MDVNGISVILPTYRGDEPDALRTAIESVLEQTRPPDELLIIEDGPLTPSLKSVIESIDPQRPIQVSSVTLSENRGLGNALRIGVEKARHGLIARMDADDISVRNRFERQLLFFKSNPETDIVGGYIEEFDSDPESPIARREVPESHRDIRQMARFRSPMNHATVMFRRKTVLSCGNYRSVDPMEDYDLWARMLRDGAVFRNIPEVLLKVRAGPDMYERRGGLKYAREELRTQLQLYQCNITSLPLLVLNSVTRVGLRLVPNRLRGVVYRTLAR